MFSSDPLHSPLGFGPVDYIELGIALTLAVLALFWRPFIAPAAARFARRTAWCMIALAVLPIGLRLILLAHHPVPSPDIYDEFGHLLVADTLMHGRLANPAHPLREFFETFFVLQQPTYSSIYPIGNGLMLALGRTLTGLAWSGVLLATGAFCALVYWMLRGWNSARSINGRTTTGAGRFRRRPDAWSSARCRGCGIAALSATASCWGSGCRCICSAGPMNRCSCCCACRCSWGGVSRASR
jgi:hypothetical protein